ncbi:hypothetical protein K440DRAFT_5359 [Wilcoxina mikolae CBS 423.85]|nr:hypothetical protein K440DRAFT_5359 [Wilcoxina mikolae CBS 423.85]
MAELFEIFNNPWEDSTSPREQTSTTEDPTPDVKQPEEEEQLVLVEGGACEVSKEENDPADGKSTPETTNAISEGLVCEQRRKDSQTELDKPQQENSTTEASTVVQTTEPDKSKEQDIKFSGKSEMLKGISAAVQAMELEEESGRLEEGEEENDAGNTYINRLKYENDKLQIENQNLTEKMLREAEELHNLRKELEVVQEQLQQALSNQRSVSLSKSIQTKPVFGVPTPLSSHLASIPPTPFGSYVGTQPLPFGASTTKITTSPSEFEAALKAPVSNGVSSSKKSDNSFTATKGSLSENMTTTPATPLLSFTPVTTGDSPFGGKKPAASVASSTGATNGSVASSRSGRTSPTAAFRDKPSEMTPS